MNIEIGNTRTVFIYQGDELIYPNYAAEENLVLHYDFSGIKNGDVTKGVARDLSGNGNNGVLNNFEYDSESGYADNGLEFDGVDDGIELDMNPSLDNQELTFEIVCRVESINSYVSYISTRVGTGGFMIIHSGTNILMQAESTSTRSSISFDIQYGKIFKLTIVIRGSEVEAFVGDESIGVGDWGYEINYGNSFSIGSEGYRYFLDGNIHSTRIYNRALSPEEIAHNYAIDKQRFNITD